MERLKKQSVGAAFAAAFPHTIPVLTGFLALGIAYGVLMQTKGYSAFWSVAMSAIAFCGSMQFVAITLLTAAFDVWGFVLGVLGILALLATTKPMVGKGYLYPLIPFNGKALRRLLLREPISRDNT